MNGYAPFLAALLALLAGLAIGKAWERYKLRDGKWFDRRRSRQSPHYILGLNFLVVEADVAHNLVVRVDLAGHTLMHERDAELRGPLGGGGRQAGRQEPDFQADTLRPHHDNAVPDVELLAFAAVAVQDHAPVRQYPVDVKEHEPDPRRAFLDRTLNHEISNPEP